ncbi:hypothetical protein ACFSKU_01330 [Pontibacter silvestris]|uniref:Uncharacterized protein n=1 Tax=Pontibacter silvestris TaxID=2305183 RepID=A0ABW4WRW0_9BACT|nr:hypothetical protein [Pontibacter silvestris]MCC9136251.1 hypothetical protein [Pontibacter silvestris]
MILLNTILPLFFSFILADTSTLQLQETIESNLTKLEETNAYFISDNSSQSPSIQTIATDMQLFGVIAGLDLNNAKYEQHQQGSHQVQHWTFEQGNIRDIYQIESTMHLDSVVTQRYLDNRPPTQQRIVNDFNFRTYIVSTATEPAKLYYMAETEQGLLSYRLASKQVEISYTSPKEGLNDILPKARKEIKQLLTSHQE